MPFNGMRSRWATVVAALGLATLGLTEVRAAAFQDLLVSNIGNGTVGRYNPTTGAFLGNIAINTPSGSPSNPRGMAVAANTNILVGDIRTNSIHAYDGTTTAQLADFVTTGSGGISQPWGITFRGGNCAPDLATQGNLFESCFESNRILQFNGATGAPLGDFVPSGTGGLRNPTGLAFAPTNAGVHAGNLFVASSGNNQILEFNGTTGAFIGAFATGGALNAPAQIQFGADGTLFVANFSGNNILRFGTSGSNGGNGTLLGTITGGGLSGTSGLALDASGNIIVTSLNDNRILRFKVDAASASGYSFDTALVTTGLAAPVYLVLCTTVIPEPSSIVLAGLGAVCLLGVSVRKHRRAV